MSDRRATIDFDRYRRIIRRKQRNRLIGMGILILLILLATVLLIQNVWQKSRIEPRFHFIVEGQVTHQIAGEALIVRDSETITAPADGLLRPFVAEGSRVASSERLAQIVPQDREADLLALTKAENDITEQQLKLMQTTKGETLRAVYAESEAAIHSIIGQVRTETNQGNLAALSLYDSSLALSLKQRNNRMLSVQVTDDTLNSLKQRRSELEAKLNLGSGQIRSPGAGVLSYRIDGLEDDLNSETILTLTADQLRDYINQGKKTSDQQTAWNSGEPVMSLYTGLYQHFAFLLPGATAGQFPLDKNFEIQFLSDGVRLDRCQVVRAEASGAGVLVVFRSDQKLAWFSDRRVVQGTITLSTAKGLRVPVSALMNYQAGSTSASILLVSQGYTRRAPVIVEDADHDYAIISAVEGSTYKPEQSTMIVINPGSIEEGVAIGD